MSECTSHLGLEWSQVTKSLMTTACVKQKKEDLLTQMADMLRNIYYWAQGTGGVCVYVCVCVYVFPLHLLWLTSRLGSCERRL